MSLRLRILALVVLSCLLGGCGRGIKEGYYAVTGSSGDFVSLHGDTYRVGQLSGEYGSVRVMPFDNEVGRACPGGFLSVLPGAIEEQLGPPFFTGPAGKTLLITGRVIHFETSDLAGKALGPMDEAICRVQILDAGTKAMLAEANCAGRVKSSVRTGPEEMAQGVGKAIRKMLEGEDKD